MIPKHTQPSVDRKMEQKKPASLIISLGIGLFIFIVLLLGMEIIFRQDWFTRLFPLRSVGSFHSQFEIKWFKLQDFVKDRGGVDVILMGNSMVNTGIDPKVLSEEYENKTGQQLRIYNFGVEGLTVAPNSHLAEILFKTYHPGTILFVTEMRDYVAANGLEAETTFESNRWIQGFLGSDSSHQTELISASSGLQRILVFRNWSRFDFLDNLLMTVKRYKDTSQAGYEADHQVGTNIDHHPDPNDPEEKANFEMFSDFQTDPGRLGDLKRMIDLNRSGAQFFTTEMPVYPTYFDYFGGESVHQQFQSEIEVFIQENGGFFIPPISWELIPVAGRADNHHLNIEGAPLFSQLLAQKLAGFCLKDGRCLLASHYSGGEK
jgi:hypothetical protein